jgi:DNA-binding GntR family transcriptional regulator
MSQTGTESNAGARPDGGPTTLTTQVYGRLRGEIIGGQLKPNEKLRLAALRQRLGVGMSAIREALSRLAAEGLVIAEDQRGFRVSPVSREDLEDLTRVRIEIERLALERSLRTGDVAWEAGVLATYHHMARAEKRGQGAGDAEAQLHRRFHDALVAACGSRWLQRFRQVVYAEAERYRRLAIGPVARKRREVKAEHQELMEAALARDVERAGRAIERHLARAAGPGARAQRRTAQAAAGPRRPKPSAAKRTAKK